MATTTFVDKVTVINTAWLNDTNSLVWTVFNGKTTAGTSGTLLRSNGTNIVNTTTTYPNTAGTTGTIIRSNGTNLVNSTATYPDTTTANQLLYSSTTNTVGGLASANSGVLVTSVGGVPSISSTLPVNIGVDDSFTITGSADATKKVRFEVDTNVTTATTRVMTVPNADGNLAYTNTTDGSLPQIISPSITATVAANALTITCGLLSMDFRSTTLSSGAMTRVTGTPANLVVSSGSTLGAVNAVQTRFTVIVMNNAGTLELAIVNVQNAAVVLGENNLATTTAEGGAGAADSAGIAYSTTARISLAYRVLGYIDSTQATSGTYVTTPSLVQSAGGNALAGMAGLGTGQAWTGVTRTSGTTYYNTTGRPIVFSTTHASQPAFSACALAVDGTTVASSYFSVAAQNGGAFISSIIPNNSSYVFTITAGTFSVIELR